MKATLKGTRISTRKVRLVADAIRNMPVSAALTTLSLVKNRGAYSLTKAVKSAVANAVANNNAQADTLVIKTLQVNEGQFLKRFKASTRGRIHPYKKRSTHITVTLGIKEEKK